MGRESTGDEFFLVGGGMSKFLANGGGHPPSRENPGLDRISIFRGWLFIKRVVTFFKRARCSFHIKNKLKF